MNTTTTTTTTTFPKGQTTLTDTYDAGVSTRRRPTPCRVMTTLLVLLTLMLSLGTPAHAQLSFLIQPAAQAGRPGDLLSYSATLTNTGTTEVFLNSDAFSLSGVGLTLDDSPFFDNFPLSLTGGQVASGELFTVLIGAGVGPGIYNGTFTIEGGPTDTSFNNLATQNFSVVVGAPEPASVSLLMLGGVALNAAYQRRRRIRAALRN